MTFYDIFNGDADGICALTQLRFVEPCAGAVLVSGVKRDVRLLERVTAVAGDVLTVLDVSMDSNATALRRLLAAGARCRYFDHHFAGEIPDSPLLQASIDTSPAVCTSLIVDRHLNGAHRAWAVVAAFGDNLRAPAMAAAAALNLDAAGVDQLRELGELINYNAYGESVADLHFEPAALYRRVAAHPDPLGFIREDEAFAMLREGYRSDMARVAGLTPEFETAGGAVFMLPDAAWSRRISGSFGNDLATAHPHRAHAVLTRRGDAFMVSVRAPVNAPRGADDLCRAFDTGGGRSGAAGINRLPDADLRRFIDGFDRQFART